MSRQTEPFNNLNNLSLFKELELANRSNDNNKLDEKVEKLEDQISCQKNIKELKFIKQKTNNLYLKSEVDSNLLSLERSNVDDKQFKLKSNTLLNNKRNKSELAMNLKKDIQKYIDQYEDENCSEVDIVPELKSFLCSVYPPSNLEYEEKVHLDEFVKEFSPSLSIIHIFINRKENASCLLKSDSQLNDLELVEDKKKSFLTNEKSDDNSYLTNYDIKFVKNIELSIQLKGLTGNWTSHLKTIELLEKYPDSTHLLYMLYIQTINLLEYEEALVILNKLLVKLPDNSELKINHIWLVEAIEKIKIKALEEENLTYNNNSINKFETLIDASNYTSKKIVDFKKRLNVLKKLPDFKNRMQKLYRLLAIHTGQIEDLYYITISATKQLINFGIEYEYIINDSKDKIFENSITGGKITRANEIKSIILNNAEVFSKVDNLILDQKELTLDIIKDLHLTFTKTARFIIPNSTDVFLIRRGKWKIFPNYVISNNEKMYFAKPSIVESFIEKIISEVNKMLKLKEDPIAIASYLHLNFINTHPFDDCNGRVCRAIVGLILQMNELLPFTVSPDKKKDYIESIKSSTSLKDIAIFANFIESQLENYLEALEADDFDKLIKN